MVMVQVFSEGNGQADPPGEDGVAASSGEKGYHLVLLIVFLAFTRAC
jgi:hypothetical protein